MNKNYSIIKKMSIRLKLVSKMSIKLAPYSDSVAQHIPLWAERTENAEFFRRCPPVCDWLAVDAIRHIFQGLWVIYEEDRPIGLAGLFAKDIYSRNTEFGMMIDQASCSDRSRAARIVFNQVADYCFNYLNLYKISIKLMPWRTKLAKRIEEHGFTKECDLRDSCYFKGEYHSEMLYSCLKLEFKEI